MDKSPEAFRTISEVAEALNVPPHVLRFWESRFTQVKPVKRGGGRRYYRPEDVQLLRGIRGLLYDDGMTIKGVQKILRERGVRHVVALGTTADGDDAAVTAPVARKPAAHRSAAPKPSVPQPLERKRVTTEAEAGPAPTPHADLFALAEAAAPFEHVASQNRPTDRAALRDLVRELQALRVAMAGEPGP